MWPFKSKDKKITKKAENIHVFLLGIVGMMMPRFLSELGKEEFSEEELCAIGLELIAISLHLMDRILFQNLPSDERDIIVDTTITNMAIAIEVADLPANLMPVQLSDDGIINIYNERTSFYTSFPELSVSDNINETLLFGFSKSLINSYSHLELTDALLPICSLVATLHKMVMEALIQAKIVKRT